jgi:protein scribble
VDENIRAVTIERDKTGGLGLTITGGLGSTPYKGDDHVCYQYHKQPNNQPLQGIFISKIIPGGPADRSGVRVGDKVITISGESVQNVDHQMVAELMRRAGDRIILTLISEDDVANVGGVTRQEVCVLTFEAHNI